jgi:hypothetical protein
MSDMQPADIVATPLTELLDSVLIGVRRDVPGEIGTAVSVGHAMQKRGAGRLEVLAATGIGQLLTPITTGHLWGPSLVVATGEEPIVTPDLWHDPRWPHLTLEAVRAQLPPRHRAEVARVVGVAAVPGVWDDQGVVVLSVYLDRPADNHVLAVLARHERLVASAITIADVATRSVGDAERVLDALASRAVIEQAKGSIMTLRRCDAVQAWAVLRQASQQFNVKLRELALAFVEHVGQAPAQHGADGDGQVVAGEAARRAAVLVWRAITEPTPAAGHTIDGALSGRALRDGRPSDASVSKPTTA